MARLLLGVLLLAMARSISAQEGHIGGSQVSNPRVSAAAGDRSTSADSTSGPAGSSHASVGTRAARSRSASMPHPAAKPEPAVLNAPTNPSTPVELSDAAFAALIVHREPAVYPELARSTHARGAVVLDVVIDENGHLESADPIGSQDLSEACMEAIQSWKFTPYRYQGRPWKVTGSVRFNFLHPQKGVSE